jgi:methyltransferase
VFGDDVSLRLYLLLLLLLYGERLAELIISRRHTRGALAAGAVEVGRAHFRWMAAFHGLFPLACALEVVLLHRPFPGLLGWLALAVFLLAQGLRWWVVATLGEAWTVRIIVHPQRSPVTAGPFRLVRHPNYVAVVLEILAVPLIHGAWLTALGGTAVNALLLRTRIPAEEAALGPAHAAAFAARPPILARRRRVPG